ncbi:MAG: barstar family protein [Clostridiales bacterium]|nr:barstar family protein [Clostridiales bacterium]
MKHERRLTLNAKRMTTRDEAHAHLSRRLRLPEWYGRNLDALNDCLGEIGAPTHLTVRYAPALEESLGEYGAKLLGVLRCAAEDNPNIRLTLRERF